jgi:hypothetical protein
MPVDHVTATPEDIANPTATPAGMASASASWQGAAAVVLTEDGRRMLNGIARG